MTPMMSSSLLTTPLASCSVYARFLRSLYIWTCNRKAVVLCVGSVVLCVGSVVLCVGSVIRLSDCALVLSLLSSELQSMVATRKEWHLQKVCHKQLIIAEITIWTPLHRQSAVVTVLTKGEDWMQPGIIRHATVPPQAVFRRGTGARHCRQETDSDYAQQAYLSSFQTENSKDGL